MRATVHIHSAVAVSFKTAVIDRAGRVARESPWQKNLILDQGLDHAGIAQWCDCFKVAAAGTGDLVVQRRDDAVTFTRATNTVTASAAFFEVGDIGRLLKFDSGEEMYVTGFTNSTHVTVGTSGTLSASQGTMWYVNATGLIAETKRTQTYSSALGANNTIVTVDTLVFKRTFIFTPEVGTVTYTEVGWAWTTSSGAGNIFGMAPMAEATQTLESGESLQIIVQMSMVLTPATITPVGDTSGGLWNTAGNQMIESLGDAVSQVASNGATVAGAALEPSSGLLFRAIQATWAQSAEIVTGALSWPVATVTASMALQSYVPGSFERAAIGTLLITQANGLIYGFGFDGGARTVSIKFTTPQTKVSTKNLVAVYKRTWQRRLLNVLT